MCIHITNVYLYNYIYAHIYIYVCTVNIYIHRERERDTWKKTSNKPLIHFFQTATPKIQPENHGSWYLNKVKLKVTMKDLSKGWFQRFLVIFSANFLDLEVPSCGTSKMPSWHRSQKQRTGWGRWRCPQRTWLCKTLRSAKRCFATTSCCVILVPTPGTCAWDKRPSKRHACRRPLPNLKAWLWFHQLRWLRFLT